MSFVVSRTFNVSGFGSRVSIGSNGCHGVADIARAMAEVPVFSYLCTVRNFFQLQLEIIISEIAKAHQLF